MCQCHKVNPATKNVERIKGIFSLKTGNVGDKFKFEHENFYRQILEVNFKGSEVFAPPIENYSGLDERGSHVFHMTFKAEFDGFDYVAPIKLSV